MSQVVLTVESVAKAFGGNQVLKDVSFSVNKGEIVGLLGPNGSGKSTLLNTITGFETTDAGSVQFEGRRINNQVTHRIIQHGVARTFQLPSMPEKMSVMEVAMAASTAHHGFWDTFLGSPGARRAEQQAYERALALTERLLLTDVRDLSAAALSGGQKKLLGIVCALMAQPRMLMLDEPTAGVHPNLRQDIVRVLRQLNEEGMTIVVVEHDMHFIRELCHRCVVLDRGHIVADCHPNELATNEQVLNAYLGTTRPHGIDVDTGGAEAAVQDNNGQAIS